MTCAIDVNNLFFNYENFSMQNIKMELHQAEHKAMVGLNGSGKTTLFKLMLGLLEPLPDSYTNLDTPIKECCSVLASSRFAS